MAAAKRIFSCVFAVLAILLVLETAAILTIMLLPATPLGEWLARNDPLFSIIKSTAPSTKPESKEEPRRIRIPGKTIYVPGPIYAYVGPGVEAYREPDFESPVIGINNRWVQLEAIREDGDWLLLPFSFGNGWVNAAEDKPRRLADQRFYGHADRDPKSQASGAEDFKTVDGLGELKIEIRIEPDFGRRPDAVYFDHPQPRPRPLLFSELSAEGSPADLVALPEGIRLERLQLAVMLVGGDAEQRVVKDYVLRCRNEAWASEAGEILSSLDEVYENTFQEVIQDKPVNRRVFVFLLPSLEAYKKFYPEAQVGAIVRTAGHYELGIVALHEELGPQGEPLRTLAHEVVHHLNHVLLGLPGDHSVTWLDEGIANYFSLSPKDAEGRLHPGEMLPGGRLGIDDTGSETVFIEEQVGTAPSRIKYLQGLIRRGGKIGLRELISAGTKEEFYSQDLLRKYSISWIAVHYLLHGADGAYRSNFLRYIEEVRKNRNSIELFEKTVGLSLKQMEKKLRDYILRL